MNPPKLIDQLRSAIRIKNYSPRNEEAWLWIKRFILFHQKRHPNKMGETESAPFYHTSYLRKVAASTQSQALGALFFLYKEAHDDDLYTEMTCS